MGSDGFATPVLMVVFNRPDTTKQVFERVRAVRPKALFVAADGPRPSVSGDQALCEEALRSVTDSIDWACDLKVLRRSQNLGCKTAMSSAISWFFDNVSSGIILEDDCIPSLSFFPFCREMLAKYQDDERIGHVGGFNCQLGRKRGSGSYYFSRYFHVWGWATWERAWDGYDVEMSDYPEFLKMNLLNDLFETEVVRRFWRKNFDSVFEGRLDTWDYQWVYKNLKEGRLAIIPNANLVQNIGFRSDATHTKDSSSEVSRIGLEEWEDADSSPFMIPNKEAEIFTYRDHLRLPLSETGEQVLPEATAFSSKELMSAIAKKLRSRLRR